jgi:hypothetical protein
MARYGYLDGRLDPAVVYGTGPWPEAWGGPQPHPEAKARDLQCGCEACWAESQAKMAMEAMEAELGPAGMKAHGGAKGRLTAVRMRWIKARNAALIAHGQSPVEVPVL